MNLFNLLKIALLSVSLLAPLPASATETKSVEVSAESLRLERPIQVSLGLGFGVGKLGQTWIPYPSLRVGYQIIEPVNLYAEIEPLWLDNRFVAGAQWTVLPHRTWSPYVFTNVVYGYTLPGDYHRLGASVGGGVDAALRNGFVFQFECGGEFGGVIGENGYYQLRTKIGLGYRF